ncbi:NAD(P)H-hydrate dehydratase [Flavobacterium sp. MAH-1]|uniref:ADP-dependent (S)-NAD(P)H-hydrate dehydratase n=1 Tax=Flavobacterium agri TaxID=2743471 RepID=A0A7Y8XZZ2_9FLAO|nr:NAD(P)H-hydrate dehydratase [Flavobacterium agri]NUY80007.1 NAD(P)H-hydrate dehydratase [Flavobacterium agri]NYA70032.1 NAD(P)H-hydrate dehydratase [Flavobacterium agri]
MKTTRLTKSHIQKIYRPANPKTHKGTQGHALLIGGSYGKMGSITLSVKAALHSGAGLVTAFIPECGYQILQTVVPEAMVITDMGHKHLSNIQYEIEPNAIGIGPGIGQEQGVQHAFHEFLRRVRKPLVVDADGLNILSQKKDWISLLPKNTILTPHPKELSRLIGEFASEEDSKENAIRFARQHKLILVLKGAPTFITDGNSLFQNTTGNAALATGGTGDVLTGIITALLAQGYEALDAAKLGVYLHGLTADLALPETGTEYFVASDVIRYLGKAFLSIAKSPPRK